MFNLEDLLETKDLWSHLQETPKPVVLYGMGDGADKILNVCEEKGIHISGVFASDEFVRYQSFRGFTVRKYSELHDELGEMIILVSFATRLDNVLEKIYNLSVSDELYAPDVPVFGEGLFDSVYFRQNFASFRSVFDMLSDEQSKKVYYDVIKYKLTGDISLLRECETPISEAYDSIIKPKPSSVYVDIGAYNGDTLAEYVSFAGKDVSAYCFEPDERNFKKLSENADALGIASAKLFNVAAWNKKEQLEFYSRSGRNSAHTTSHNGAKVKYINADRPDVFIDSDTDFVNIDAEGSDFNAIEGLSKTIERSRPTISCAVYHRNEDMFAIPLLLAEKYKNFKMYFRHFPYVPAWDTNVYIKNGD